MSEVRYRLRRNTPYSLQFTVPAGTTPALMVDNGGTFVDYAGATETVVDGTQLTIRIDPLATDFPGKLAIVDTTTGKVMHDVFVRWSDNPNAGGVPGAGTVDLSRLAFDPATQTELNVAQTDINTALAAGLAGKENVGVAAAQAVAVRDELLSEMLKQHRTVTANTALSLLDQGNVVEVDVASVVGGTDTVVTVPADATVALPVGSEVCVTVIGTNPVAFAPEAGVTIRSVGGARRMTAQYGKAVLVKRAANDWLLSSPNLVA